MEYRTLGRCGLKVSAISIGSWRTYGQQEGIDRADACLSAAYDAGVNYFDGAEAYGDGAAEEALGAVFARHAWPRDTYIVSSKVIKVGDAPTQRGLSRKHLVEACDAALRRMGLDYLDLFFCHRPDPATPLEEIVHTMNELITRGKICYWGTSEFVSGDLMQMYSYAERHGMVGPTMEQTRHNLLFRERVHGELKPLFARYGLGTTIYSPLAVGILTGKYNDGIPPDSAVAKGGEDMKRRLEGGVLEQTRQLAALADELGISCAQLALAWCLKDPNVSTAIIGASKSEQVADNAAAVDQLDRLDEDVMARIAAIID
ncbi:MAG: aldo/keto reductase [Planctomycetota bacterium]